MNLRLHTWSLTTLLAALSTSVDRAEAQQIGAMMPELAWKTRFNFGSLTAEKLSELRGSAVLVEFFTTAEPACIQLTARLNALHENRAKDGLVVVAVTSDAEPAVRLFVRDHEVRYPVAIGGSSQVHVDLVPHEFLIDPEGRIAWRGRSSDLDPALLDQVLVKARPATFAAGLEAVSKLLAADEPGKAHALCRELLAGGKLGDDAREQAQRICADVEAAAQSTLAAGDTALAAEELYDAVTHYERAIRLYPGLPGIDDAAAKVAEIRADRRRRRELDAGHLLASGREQARQRDYDLAFKTYKAVVSGFTGTKAGKTAADLATALEKGGKLGFQRGCGACEGAGRACPLHRKKK